MRASQIVSREYDVIAFDNIILDLGGMIVVLGIEMSFCLSDRLLDRQARVGRRNRGYHERFSANSST